MRELALRLVAAIGGQRTARQQEEEEAEQQRTEGGGAQEGGEEDGSTALPPLPDKSLLQCRIIRAVLGMSCDPAPAVKLVLLQNVLLELPDSFFSSIGDQSDPRLRRPLRQHKPEAVHGGAHRPEAAVHRGRCPVVRHRVVYY